VASREFPSLLSGTSVASGTSDGSGAAVNSGLSLGSGASVASGVSLGSGVSVASGVSLDSGVLLGLDVSVFAGVTTAAGVGAGVDVGDASFVHPRAACFSRPNAEFEFPCAAPLAAAALGQPPLSAIAGATTKMTLAARTARVTPAANRGTRSFIS
jgi:hypothetical protein